jgi:hypothetical protein
VLSTSKLKCCGLTTSALVGARTELMEGMGRVRSFRFPMCCCARGTFAAILERLRAEGIAEVLSCSGFLMESLDCSGSGCY